MIKKTFYTSATTTRQSGAANSPLIVDKRFELLLFPNYVISNMWITIFLWLIDRDLLCNRLKMLKLQRRMGFNCILLNSNALDGCYRHSMEFIHLFVHFLFDFPCNPIHLSSPLVFNFLECTLFCLNCLVSRLLTSLESHFSFFPLLNGISPLLVVGKMLTIAIIDSITSKFTFVICDEFRFRSSFLTVCCGISTVILYLVCWVAFNNS